MKNINLLLVSGWATDYKIWEKLNPLLADCGKQVRMEWWQGLDDGLSAEFTTEQNPNGAIRLGVGWSMGGLLLLEALADQKIKLDRLVLISSTARMTRADKYSGISGKVLRAMQIGLSSDSNKVVADFFRQAFSPSIDQTQIELCSERGQNIDVTKLKKGLLYLEQTDLRDSLGKINIPTLVIHGEQDAIIPVDNGRYLAEHIDQCRWVSLPSQGHVLPKTASKELAREIMDFII